MRQQQSNGVPTLTLAIWSNFPNSSLSTTTSSLGEQSLASRVKPTMSAYKILVRVDRVWIRDLIQPFSLHQTVQLIHMDSYDSRGNWVFFP